MSGDVHVNQANPMMSSYQGPSPVMEVGFDMVKRGAVLAPIFILVGTLIWGTDGAASVGLGLGLVLVNVWLSAWIIQTTARISFAALAAGAMFGFLIRLGIISAVVILVRNESWVDLVALGVTIIISHLGLLFWELRYISASLAFPGLKPGAGLADNTTKESVAS